MRSSIRTVSLNLSRSSLASFISAAVAASVVAALSPPAAAQPPVERKQIQATRVVRPPVMDGKLDDEVWKQAVPITDFHQTRPGDGTAASEATEVSVVYTEDAIYISARMGDSDPEMIAAPTIRHGQGLGRRLLATALESFRQRGGSHRRLFCGEFEMQMMHKTQKIQMQYQSTWPTMLVFLVKT